MSDTRMLNLRRGHPPPCTHLFSSGQTFKLPSLTAFNQLAHRNQDVVEDGWITGFTGVKRVGLTVYIQKYGIEGPLFRLFGDQGDNSGFQTKSSTEVQSKASRRVYRIFDRVQVHIEVASVNDYDEELVLSLVE